MEHKLLLLCIFGGIAFSQLMEYCEHRAEIEARCRTKTFLHYLEDGQILTCPDNSHVVVERDANKAVTTCRCVKP